MVKGHYEGHDDEVKAFYNRLYSGWYSEHQAGEHIDFIDDWPPGKLLDVGCGKGDLLKYAHDRGHSVYGLDLSPVALEMAAADVPSAGLSVGVAKEMPFDDESFDYVTCLGSLEHFAEPQAAVLEMARILKVDGKAVVAVPNSHHVEAILNSARYGISGHDGQIVEELGTLNQWREMLEENGLSVAAIDKYNKRPPLRPFNLTNVLLRAARPFTPLNLSYLFIFRCEKAGPGRSGPWSHRISALQAPGGRVCAGAGYDTRFELINTGYKLWPTPEISIFPVNFGWQVRDPEGSVVHEGRTALRRPVPPAGRLVVRARFTAPCRAGEHQVTWDLIREGDFWFADRGSKPVTRRIIIEKP